MEGKYLCIIAMLMSSQAARALGALCLNEHAWLWLRYVAGYGAFAAFAAWLFCAVELIRMIFWAG